MAKKFEFAKKIKLLQSAKSKLPVKIGGIALKHFQKSFRDGGFTDLTFDAWTARKSKNKSDRRNKKTRALLVDSGVLKNSGKVKTTNWSRVVVGFYGTKYGEYHNRGLGNNPKRQFIGSSQRLIMNVRNEIAFEVNKIMKS